MENTVGRKGRQREKIETPHSHLTFKVILMFTLTFFCIHTFEIKIEPFFLKTGTISKIHIMGCCV